MSRLVTTGDGVVAQAGHLAECPRRVPGLRSGLPVPGGARAVTGSGGLSTRVHLHAGQPLPSLWSVACSPQCHLLHMPFLPSVGWGLGFELGFQALGLC